MTFGEQLLLAYLDEPMTLLHLAAAWPELNIRATVRALVDQGVVAVSTEDQWQMFATGHPVLVRRRRGVRGKTLYRLEREAGLSRWRYLRRRAGGRRA